MNPSSNTRKEQQLVSYLYLRMLIGACGIALVASCLVYAFILGHGMQDSVSDFYYTGVRDIFVGVLFVLGFFLLSYKGYDRIDSRFANAGFFFALGVALFPCKGPMASIHFISAVLLFSVFIFFSLKLFPLGATAKKNLHDVNIKIYKTAGLIMIGCLLSISITYLPPLQEFRLVYNTTFWLEAIALICFAVSWLTKGKFLTQTKAAFQTIRTKPKDK